MIESEMLAPEAAEYLNGIEQEKAQEAKIQQRRAVMDELLAFCNEWITKAKEFRSSTYETDWLTYQRNADGKYDPQLAAKKESWQSKAFVDLTPSHR